MMQTLDQAIQNRINEKRLAREAAKQAERELKAEIKQREERAALEARRILETQYDVDLDGVTITATCSHADFYLFELHFGEHEVQTNSSHTTINDLRADYSQWVALHQGAMGYNREIFENLIDAILFAKFGTTDPGAVAAITSAEDF